MKTLDDVLKATQNGQVILDEAIRLGFQTVHLFKSTAESALCLVVDLSNTSEPTPSAVESAFWLKYKIARLLDCKTIILQHPLISSTDKKYIDINSIDFPVQDIQTVINIFGKPEKFKLKTLDEDKLYKIKLDVYGEALLNSGKKRKLNDPYINHVIRGDERQSKRPKHVSPGM